MQNDPMTPDTAIRAAEALIARHKVMSWRSRLEPYKSDWENIPIEEIASILRPFMETQESERIETLTKKFHRTAATMLTFLAECRRKDEEISSLKSSIKRYEDSAKAIHEDNKNFKGYLP
jgi:hypothetical protein